MQDAGGCHGLGAQNVIEETSALMKRRATAFGASEWPAMLRLLERIDPGYKL